MTGVFAPHECLPTDSFPLDFIKVCRVSWPNDPSPHDGGAYAER
jgi:hypothetical protein